MLLRRPFSLLTLSVVFALCFVSPIEGCGRLRGNQNSFLQGLEGTEEKSEAVAPKRGGFKKGLKKAALLAGAGLLGAGGGFLAGRLTGPQASGIPGLRPGMPGAGVPGMGTGGGMGTGMYGPGYNDQMMLGEGTHKAGSGTSPFLILGIVGGVIVLVIVLGVACARMKKQPNNRSS